MRNIFLAPFTSYLWAAIATAFLVLTATMTAFAFLLEKSAKIEQFDSTYIYDSRMVAIASLCQQGTSAFNSFVDLFAGFLFFQVGGCRRFLPF